MPKSVFEKAKVLVLALLITFSIAAPALISPVQAAPTVPSTNNYPFTHDPDFNTNNPNCWQVGLIGPYPRQSQNLPEGYWYPNTAFDSAWFPNNYAIVGGDGKATLHAYSTYDLLWGGRGWANAFVHQGSPVYTGVYEGRFKAGQTSSSAIPVDGIRYPINTQEPTGKTYLTIRARLTQNNLYCWQSNNGLLISFIFQYEFQDGSLSQYSSPPFTNDRQSLHVDLFIHRDFKFVNVPGSLPVGWSFTQGDAYNSDAHMQYVYNSHMNVGQWYTFTIDYGDFINNVKARALSWLPQYYGFTPSALILKYIQISAETIGGEIGAEIDYLIFTTT